MKIYKNPSKDRWAEIIARPRLDLTKLNDTVATVLADVKARGDEAVKEYELKFDKAELKSLAVTEAEMDEAEQLVSNELRDAIILAHHNIKVFHISQRFVGQKVKTQEGVVCWQKSVAIEKVGLYIPGGTAPLFSTVLMLATPAKIAGCKEIVLCTPPNKEVAINGAREWDDESAQGEEPYAQQIGDSSPFSEVVKNVTEAVLKSFYGNKKKV